MSNSKVWDKVREISKGLKEKGFSASSCFSTLDWTNGVMIAVEKGNVFIGEIHVLGDLTIVDEDNIINTEED